MSGKSEKFFTDKGDRLVIGRDDLSLLKVGEKRIEQINVLTSVRSVLTVLEHYGKLNENPKKKSAKYTGDVEKITKTIEAIDKILIPQHNDPSPLSNAEESLIKNMDNNAYRLYANIEFRIERAHGKRCEEVQDFRNSFRESMKKVRENWVKPDKAPTMSL